jgi:hypothetical protein
MLVRVNHSLIAKANSSSGCSIVLTIRSAPQ